jgi:hypothetical protein
MFFSLHAHVCSSHLFLDGILVDPYDRGKMHLLLYGLSSPRVLDSLLRRSFREQLTLFHALLSLDRKQLARRSSVVRICFDYSVKFGAMAQTLLSMA